MTGMLLTPGSFPVHVVFALQKKGFREHILCFRTFENFSFSSSEPISGVSSRSTYLALNSQSAICCVFGGGWCSRVVFDCFLVDVVVVTSLGFRLLVLLWMAKVALANKKAWPTSRTLGTKFKNRIARGNFNGRGEGWGGRSPPPHFVLASLSSLSVGRLFVLFSLLSSGAWRGAPHGLQLLR